MTLVALPTVLKAARKSAYEQSRAEPGTARRQHEVHDWQIWREADIDAGDDNGFGLIRGPSQQPLTRYIRG